MILYLIVFILIIALSVLSCVIVASRADDDIEKLFYKEKLNNIDKREVD